MDWSIQKLIHEDSGSLSKAITAAISTFTLTISGSRLSQGHITSFPSVHEKNFVPWDNLSENTVKGFISNVEGGGWNSTTASYETQMSNSIASQNDNGLPW